MSLPSWWAVGYERWVVGESWAESQAIAHWQRSIGHLKPTTSRCHDYNLGDDVQGTRLRSAKFNKNCGEKTIQTRSESRSDPKSDCFPRDFVDHQTDFPQPMSHQNLMPFCGPNLLPLRIQIVFSPQLSMNSALCSFRASEVVSWIIVVTPLVNLKSVSNKDVQRNCWHKMLSGTFVASRATIYIQETNMIRRFPHIRRCYPPPTHPPFTAYTNHLGGPN